VGPRPRPRTRPRFRADQVGSLLRPPELKAAHRELDLGRLSPEEFTTILDRAVREVIRLQEEVGLEAITDGEFRRISYWARFVDRVDGLGVAPARFRFHDAAGSETDFLAPRVEAPVRRRQPIAGDEYDFVRAHTRKTPKVTLPSPPTMQFWGGKESVSPTAYPDLDAYFLDLARVYREEIADLSNRGADYLQIDEVPLAMLAAERVRQQVRDAGVDPEDLIDRYIELIDQALADRPVGMTIAMHLCRGNFKGRWLSEGGYEPVAERLFDRPNVDCFFLEYDTPRAGDFAPLRFVPPGKSVVLGLVSSKTPILEPIDDLLRRVDQASHYLELDRLGISPQCGFASTVGGNPLSIDDQRRKLALVVELARQVWAE
jgi:5-methyltetrahydropteroyltriglutamate--homocysteine methyltransferase